LIRKSYKGVGFFLKDEQDNRMLEGMKKLGIAKRLLLHKQRPDSFHGG
jgi:hypothetical protein